MLDRESGVYFAHLNDRRLKKGQGEVSSDWLSGGRNGSIAKVACLSTIHSV